MRKLTLNYLIIAALAISAVFTSCGKDGDKNGGEVGVVTQITAKIENAAEYGSFNMVALRARYLGSLEILAEAEFKNGGFTLQLPEMVDEKFLRNAPFGGSSTITISNKDAKFLYSADISLFNSDYGNYFITFVASNETETTLSTKQYWYVDSDVNISGKEPDFSSSLTLKKGWNVVYIIIHATGRGVQSWEYRSSPPVGGLKWQRE